MPTTGTTIRVDDGMHDDRLVTHFVDHSLFESFDEILANLQSLDVVLNQPIDTRIGRDFSDRLVKSFANADPYRDGFEL